MLRQQRIRARSLRTEGFELSRLRVDTLTAGTTALTAGTTAQLPDSGLMIFVQPRCVASLRLITFIDGRFEAAKSEVPVIVAVVAERDEARRLG